MPRSSKDWERKLQTIADDAGKGPLHPVLLSLCADQLRQWELMTEELTTRPALVDEAEHKSEHGSYVVRSTPPEFNMQSRLVQAIRGLLKDLGLVDLSADPLKKLRNRLGVGVN